MTNITRLPCTWQGFPRDAYGCYPLEALIRFGDCTVQANTCFAINAVPVDKHGHAVFEENEKLAECLHDKKPLARWRPKKTTERKRMDDTQETGAAVSDAQIATPAAPVAAKEAEHVALTEVPGVPLNATEDIKALLPKDGSGGSMITVMLALVAVGGGGAAWKFYQTFAKQKHDQKMKELELKAEAQQNKNDDNHQKCAAERVMLEGKVSALEARLAEAEKTAKEAAAAAEAASKGSSELELPFDADDLQDRLAKLEKALSPPVKKKPGRPKKVE